MNEKFPSGMINPKQTNKQTNKRNTIKQEAHGAHLTNIFSRRKLDVMSQFRLKLAKTNLFKVYTVRQQRHHQKRSLDPSAS